MWKISKIKSNRYLSIIIFNDILKRQGHKSHSQNKRANPQQWICPLYI